MRLVPRRALGAGWLIASTIFSMIELPCASLAQGWSPVTTGPTGGASTISAGANRLALAAASNRVYVSTDGGETWVRKTDGLPTTSFIISASYVGNGIMVVGGYAGANPSMYRSVNGGEKWEPVTINGLNESDRPRISSISGLGTSLFAGDHALGVFRSTDNGASWAAANTGLPDFNGQRIANKVFAAHGKIFAAVSNGGLFSSANGDSWSPANAFFSRSGNAETRYLGKDMALAEDGTLYAMLENAYVYRSTNGGETWTQVADTLPNANTIPLNLVQIEVVGNTLFVLGQDYSQVGGPIKVYRTENRGDTWSEVSLTGIQTPGFNFLDGAHGYLYMNGSGALYRMQVLAAVTGPNLTYSLANGVMTLCWARDGKTYQLQRATAIPAAWENDATPPTSSGGNDCVSITIPKTGRAWYRLLQVN